jgi:hypothetical protein
LILAGAVSRHVIACFEKFLRKSNLDLLLRQMSNSMIDADGAGAAAASELGPFFFAGCPLIGGEILLFSGDAT